MFNTAGRSGRPARRTAAAIPFATVAAADACVLSCAPRPRRRRPDG